MFKTNNQISNFERKLISNVYNSNHGEIKLILEINDKYNRFLYYYIIYSID